MHLTEETVWKFEKMSSDDLRTVKINTADAKEGTYHYLLFRLADRLLREREEIRLFRTL